MAAIDEKPRRSAEESTLERDATHSRRADARAVAAEAPSVDLTGCTLLHLRLVHRLGEGGMGVVYKAFDEKLRRAVAVKVLAPRYVADDRNRMLMFREARSAAALNHPHIAAIHELHDGADGAFFVMELVEGETLRARLTREGCASLGDALRWSLQIARALSCAHGAGVVHRDLKAENVMLTKSGEVKLLDFGIAKVVDFEEPFSEEPRNDAPAALAPTMLAVASTAHGRVMGTPAYMAPEQARGAAVDARADVFALGVLLYEMLSGHVPFAHRQGAPWTWGDGASSDWRPSKPLRRVANDVPRPVADVVARCLAYDPDARPRDGAALATELERCAQTSRSAMRRMAVVVAALVAVLLTLLRLGLVGRGAEDARTQGTPGPLTRALDPAARDAFERATDDLRRGDAHQALRDLDRAIEREPLYASAHLQHAFLETSRAVFSLESVRGHVSVAKAHRAELSPEERELMDALEPELADSADWEEAARRFTRMGDQRPDYATAWYAAGVAFVKAWQSERASAAIKRALAIDTGAVAFMDLLADVDDNYDSARATLEECIRRSPTTTDCRIMLLVRLEGAGDCTAAEQAARDLVAIAPSEPWGYSYRANALAALGAPTEAISQLLDQRHARIADVTRRNVTTAMDDAILATRAGDFTRAFDRLEAAESAAGAEAASLISARRMRIQLLEWIGDAAAVRRVASDLLHREQALPVPDMLRYDWRPFFLAATWRAGGLSTDEYHRARDGWITEWRTRTAPPMWSALGVYAWQFAFADARTPRDARSALDALPSFGVLPDPRAPEATVFREHLGVGRVLRLAGRLDDSLRYLEASSRTCSLEVYPDVQYELGLTRELLNDREGACAAFTKVLTAWGRAKPRPRLVDDARARAARLRCSGMP